jgi:solute carrier family 25 protein 44
MYNGTYDAFRKIIKGEGIHGLYRGFWLSNLMVFSQVSYITTYEGVRHYLANHTPLTNSYWRSLIGGGCASLVGQTFMVPIDVISQHLQMLGLQKDGAKLGHKALNLPAEALKTRFGATQAIIAEVYRLNGIRGFYHGYGASLTVYVPNSACWWLLYDFYNREFHN